MNILSRAATAVKSWWSRATDTVADGFRYWFPLMGGWSAASYRTLARLALRNPHANRGLRLLHQTAAAVPLIVQRMEKGEWTTVSAEEREAAMLALFDRPDKRTSRYRFFEMMVLALYAGGEFWVEKRAPVTGENRGRARSLRLILPDEFEAFIRDAETDEVTGYRFRSRVRGRLYTRTVDEVLHVRTFNPADGEDADRGLPILVGGQALQAMQHGATWNEAIAKGGGRVPGYWRPTGLEPGQQLDAETVEEAEANFDRRKLERASKNAEMVLSGSFERVQGDVTPKDADWLKGDQNNLRKVAVLLGIPPTLLGDQKGGSLTDAGVDSEVRALLLLTVLPLLSWVLSELSPFLLAPGYRFWYDRDQIEALQEDTNAMWERFGKAYKVYGLITRREARTAITYPADPEADMVDPGPLPEEPPVPAIGGDGQTSQLPTLSLDRVKAQLRARYGEMEGVTD